MSMITDTLASESIYTPRPAEFAFAGADRSARSNVRAKAAPDRIRFRALRVIGLALAAILIFLGASFAGGFFMGLVDGVAKSARQVVTPQTLLLILQIAIYLPLAATAFVRPRRIGADQWRADIGWKGSEINFGLIGQVLGIQILCLIWVVATMVLTSQYGAPGKPNVGSLPLILAVVLLAPVAEEIFFRGWLQARAARLLPAWGAVAFTSVLFALAHYNGSFVKPLAILALGVGTSWLRQRSGSLIPGTLLHVLNNAVVVALLQLG